MTKRWLCTWIVLACCSVAVSACDDEAGPPRRLDGGDDAGNDDAGDRDAGDRDAGSLTICDAREDGTPCGPDRHCVRERCLFNRCGDGVIAGNEQCDDGNQMLGDRCTPSCRAVRGVCGDGVTDSVEQCDDGNRDDLDDCSNACLRQSHADAGTGPSVDEMCPKLERLVITPHTGDPEYLVGWFWTVTWEMSVEPARVEWQIERRSTADPPRAEVIALVGGPLDAGLQCNRQPALWSTVSDPGEVIVRALMFHPGCTAVAYETTLVCPERGRGMAPTSSGGTGGSSGVGGSGGAGGSGVGGSSGNGGSGGA